MRESMALPMLAERLPQASGPSGWAIALAVVAVVSAVIALAALWTTRSLNTRRAVLTLVEHLHATRLDLAMWRMDQLTRHGEPVDSIEPKDIDELRERWKGSAAGRTLDSALGTNWGVRRAEMHDAFYFAARVHAWLKPDRGYVATLLEDGMSLRAKVRLLNDTFAHRLLMMFVDHRIVACRLRAVGRDQTYYATYYGVFDARYGRLVDELYDDLERRNRIASELHAIKSKYFAVIEYRQSNRECPPPLTNWDAEPIAGDRQAPMS